MNKISLCTIVLIIPILICCSADNLSQEETNTQSKKIQEKDIHVLSRSVNPYDTLGILQNQVLEIYLSEDYTYTSLEDIFQEVTLITQTVTNTTYTRGTVPLEDLLYIRDNPQSSLDTFIENSNLSSAAQASFSDFVTSLSLINEGDYQTLYDVITDYELFVTNNTNFTSEDKAILLSTTALIHYSFIFLDKRKDKDWETSVGNRNISPKFQGTMYDSTTAIIMSATMELYLNINQ